MIRGADTDQTKDRQSTSALRIFGEQCYVEIGPGNNY